MHRALLLSALALLLSVAPALAQQTASDPTAADSSTATARNSDRSEFGVTQTGFWILGGVHAGRPTLASAAVGGAFGFGPHLPGSMYAEVEPGITGMRYGVGVMEKENLTWTSLAVSAVHHHAWRTGMGARRGVRYRGVQVTGTFLAISLRMARLVGTVDGASVSLTTVDVGLGF